MAISNLSFSRGVRFIRSLALAHPHPWQFFSLSQHLQERNQTRAEFSSFSRNYAADEHIIPHACAGIFLFQHRAHSLESCSGIRRDKPKCCHGYAPSGNSRASKNVGNGTAQMNGIMQKKRAVVNDANGIRKKAARDSLAAMRSPEHDSFDAQEARVGGERHAKLAAKKSTIEENRLLGKPFHHGAGAKRNGMAHACWRRKRKRAIDPFRRLRGNGCCAPFFEQKIALKNVSAGDAARCVQCNDLQQSSFFGPREANF